MDNELTQNPCSESDSESEPKRESSWYDSKVYHKQQRVNHDARASEKRRLSRGGFVKSSKQIHLDGPAIASSSRHGQRRVDMRSLMLHKARSARVASGVEFAKRAKVHKSRKVASNGVAADDVTVWQTMVGRFRRQMEVPDNCPWDRERLLVAHTALCLVRSEDRQKSLQLMNILLIRAGVEPNPGPKAKSVKTRVEQRGAAIEKMVTDVAAAAAVSVNVARDVVGLVPGNVEAQPPRPVPQISVSSTAAPEPATNSSVPVQAPVPPVKKKFTIKELNEAVARNAPPSGDKAPPKHDAADTPPPMEYFRYESVAPKTSRKALDGIRPTDKEVRKALLHSDVFPWTPIVTYDVYGMSQERRPLASQNVPRSQQALWRGKCEICVTFDEKSPRRNSWLLHYCHMNRKNQSRSCNTDLHWWSRLAASVLFWWSSLWLWFLSAEKATHLRAFQFAPCLIDEVVASYPNGVCLDVLRQNARCRMLRLVALPVKDAERSDILWGSEMLALGCTSRLNSPPDQVYEHPLGPDWCSDALRCSGTGLVDVMLWICKAIVWACLLLADACLLLGIVLLMWVYPIPHHLLSTMQRLRVFASTTLSSIRVPKISVPSMRLSFRATRPLVWTVRILLLFVVALQNVYCAIYHPLILRSYPLLIPLQIGGCLIIFALGSLNLSKSGCPSRRTTRSEENNYGNALSAIITGPPPGRSHVL